MTTVIIIQANLTQEESDNRHLHRAVACTVSADHAPPCGVMLRGENMDGEVSIFLRQQGEDRDAEELLAELTRALAELRDQD